MVDWSALGSALVQASDGHGDADLGIREDGLDHFMRIFLSLGAEATVESPPVLMATLCEQAGARLTRYRGAPATTEPDENWGNQVGPTPAIN